MKNVTETIVMTLSLTVSVFPLGTGVNATLSMSALTTTIDIILSRPLIDLPDLLVCSGSCSDTTRVIVVSGTATMKFVFYYVKASS